MCMYVHVCGQGMYMCLVVVTCVGICEGQRLVDIVS